MSLQFVLAPLFVQVALTFYVLFGMAKFRRDALVSRKTRVKDIALRGNSRAWPERAAQFADSYQNQFEAPVLFYVLTVLELITRQADILFVLLSWIYVVLRIGQAFIHTTHNRVQYRGMFFGASMLVLLMMWIAFAIRIYLL
jgi:hypothetical protein